MEVRDARGIAVGRWGVHSGGTDAWMGMGAWTMPVVEGCLVEDAGEGCLVD